jgi:hypothetical protein
LVAGLGTGGGPLRLSFKPADFLGMPSGAGSTSKERKKDGS